MTTLQKKTAILIGGPTASGKSHLALKLAEACHGFIINADSLQIYPELPVLSAQPTEENRVAIPHFLYGVLPGTYPCSAGLWSQMASKAVEEGYSGAQQPFIVGGTGFYLSALREGLSPIPPIPPEIRRKAKEHREEIGAERFYKDLQRIDPESASRLHAYDQQRVMRAWEVYRATGKSLSFWHTLPKVSPLPQWDFFTLHITAPRETLQQKAEARLHRMLEEGALEEVKTLLEKNIPREAPIFKTLGARPFADHLEGRLSLDEALQETRQQTFAYIKRQQTWFQYQFSPSYEIRNFSCETSFEEARSVLKHLVTVT